MRSSALRVPLALALSVAAARAETIERILAVVDGRPLLLSEVVLVERVKGLERRAALETLIDQRLMFREASRLPQAAVTAEEEARALLRLAESLPSGGGDEEALRALARRELAILKYVEFRFRPQVRVDEEAVHAAWEAESGRDGSRPYEEAAPEIRRRLSEQDLKARVDAWVAELRQAAEIRYNPPS